MKEVAEFISFMNKQFEEIGYTVWAAQEKSSGKLSGILIQSDKSAKLVSPPQ